MRKAKESAARNSIKTTLLLVYLGDVHIPFTAALSIVLHQVQGRIMSRLLKPYMKKENITSSKQTYCFGEMFVQNHYQLVRAKDLLPTFRVWLTNWNKN